MPACCCWFNKKLSKPVDRSLLCLLLILDPFIPRPTHRIDIDIDTAYRTASQPASQKLQSIDQPAPSISQGQKSSNPTRASPQQAVRLPHHHMPPHPHVVP